ncbi:uncharacterized protein LTR77_000154 [Saxophila tyrrhenica]|uniref:Cytochrome P450 n=1 Tax=Saxophila tyrrhenica TaxID=1690608 RepID=A0AAV9PRM7_9PEZI|nr:hypothetical protein LTR77_000154 [Saxophila tyrrhenica]
MELLQSILSTWPLLATLLPLTLLYLLLTTLLTYFRPSLRSLPGPFLARISSLPRLWTCYTGSQHLHHLHLHDKYGPFVRVGPNHVSFSNPSLIPVVYSISSKFVKSDFYTLFDIKTPAGAMPTIFSVRDEAVHKGFKRPVAGAYAMSALRELEGGVDECTEIFMGKMEERVGGEVDLGVWVHWYAWDTITTLTFSNRLDFMAREQDIQGIISAINARLKYNSIIGQAPWLHKYIFGNRFAAYLATFIPSLAILNSSKYIVDFTAAQLRHHQSLDSKPPSSPSEGPGHRPKAGYPDMLSRFRRSPALSSSELLSHATGNIFAGSDTTAASLRSIFYHLCLSPSALSTLQNEISTASAKGNLSDPVTFAEAQALPYLQAVIKEALRMHPAVGLLLERLAPSPEGLTLPNGIHLPAGTVVGMNPWVSARDPLVYPSPYTFKPERWLEASEEELKLMERNFLAFGGGSRTCLGKNISLLEMGKLVPQVLRRFEFELAEPGKEWVMEDYWFVQQRELVCRVKRREGGMKEG